MSTMTATTIITATDRASAVFARVGAAAKASAGHYTAAAAAIRNASSMFASLAGIAGPAAAASVIARTQNFEKRALGVAMAGITDAFERASDGTNRYIVNLEKVRAEADKVRQSAMGLSRDLGISPTGLITAGEAVAKMGIDLPKIQGIMRTSGLMNLQDPDGTIGNMAEFLGTLAIQFKAPPDVENFTKWITQTGDMVALAASATRTSITKMQDGLRQFSGLYASLGVSREETISLLGGMVQGGLVDAESGTALKSAMVKLLNPTAAGLGVLSKWGMRREDYMDVSLADPRRAVQQIVTMYPGQIGKRQKTGLFKFLDKSQRDGSWQKPEFYDRVLRFINKTTGAVTQEDKDNNALKVWNAITTSGGRFDGYRFFKDAAERKKDGRATASDLVSLVDGRQSSRLSVLLDNFGSEVERVLGIMKRADGSGLAAGQKLYAESGFGQYESAMASLERAMIRLRESEAFAGLIKGFERLAGFVADLPKPVQQLAGYAVAAGVALGTISTAAWLAGPALGALVGSPMIAGLAAVAAGVVLLKEPVAELAKSFDEAGREAFELIERWASDNFGPTTNAVSEWFKRQAAEIESEVNRLTAGPLTQLKGWFDTNLAPTLDQVNKWAGDQLKRTDSWFDQLRERSDTWGRDIENSLNAWIAKQNPDNYSVGRDGPKPLRLLDLTPIRVTGTMNGSAELTVYVKNGETGVVQETRRMPLRMAGQLDNGTGMPGTGQAWRDGYGER